MINPGIWEVLCVLLLIGAICIAALDQFLTFQAAPGRVRRSCENGFISLWSGISLAIIFYMWMAKNYNPAPPDVWHLLPNRSITHKNPNSSDDPRLQFYENKPVVFITPTDYSVIQNALLTKVAQSLFPVRDSVVWIVVSLPLDSSDESEELIDKENTTFAEEMLKQETLEQVHWKNLDTLLKRFGIPYVLLSSHKSVKTTWAGFTWPTSTVRAVAGYQVGLMYAVEKFHNGVIMLGDDHFAYNSAIYKEVQQTKVASCWPIAFGPSEAAVTMPLTTKTKGHTHIIGYSDGRTIRRRTIFMEVGAFAIDLEYLRSKIPYIKYWKLTFDRAFTYEDFQIDIGSIQVLGKEGSEIYVWRTETAAVSWPESISMSNFMENTNIRPLLKNALGIRFELMKSLVKKENHSFYEDYNFDRDIRSFMGEDYSVDK